MVVDPFTKLLDRVARRPGEDRSADNSNDGITERFDYLGEPFAMHHAIGVGERHDIAFRLPQPAIPRGSGTSLPFVENDGAVAVALQYRRGAVTRGVVDQQKLEIVSGKSQGEDGLDAFFDRTLAVVNRNDDGNPGHAYAEAATLLDGRQPMRWKNRT